MERFFGIEGIERSRLREPVVTVGYFDGVHRGHQALLRDLISWASDVRGTPVVVTFDEHPLAVLHGGGPPRITSLEHRIILLDRQGIGAVIILRFDHDMARWTPEDFVEKVLRRAIGSRLLLLGFDSALGRDRVGTVEYMQRAAPRLGIEVRSTPPVLFRGRRISSTDIREAILDGRLGLARELMGRDASLLARVAPGRGIGRSIGFPTANLEVRGVAVPPVGVYIVRVGIVAGTDPGPTGWYGLLNVGRRPTVAAVPEAAEAARFNEETDTVEVHIRGFEGDLYGETVEVSVLERIRGERRFESVDALASQIRRDMALLDRRVGEPGGGAPPGS